MVVDVRDARRLAVCAQRSLKSCAQRFFPAPSPRSSQPATCSPPCTSLAAYELGLETDDPDTPLVRKFAPALAFRYPLRALTTEPSTVFFVVATPFLQPVCCQALASSSPSASVPLWVALPASLAVFVGFADLVTVANPNSDLVTVAYSNADVVAHMVAVVGGVAVGVVLANAVADDDAIR